jgi:hypothetical protein
MRIKLHRTRPLAVTQHRRTPPAGGHSEAFRWTGVSSFPAAVQAAGSYRHLTLDQTSDGCETGRGWSIRFGRRQGFEMSRRAFNPTAEQRGCVETLIGYGFSEAEICLLIKNPETDKFWERTRRRHVVESFRNNTEKDHAGTSRLSCSSERPGLDVNRRGGGSSTGRLSRPRRCDRGSGSVSRGRRAGENHIRQRRRHDHRRVALRRRFRR